MGYELLPLHADGRPQGPERMIVPDEDMDLLRECTRELGGLASLPDGAVPPWLKLLKTGCPASGQGCDRQDAVPTPLLDEIRRWRPEDGTTGTPAKGIAAHKLLSKDGWIVTPEECSDVLEKLHAVDGAQVENKSIPSLSAIAAGTAAAVHCRPELASRPEALHRFLELWSGWLRFLYAASGEAGFQVWEQR